MRIPLDRAEKDCECDAGATRSAAPILAYPLDSLGNPLVRGCRCARHERGFGQPRARRLRGGVSPRLLGTLLRIVFDLAVLGVALFALLLLALRFAVLPKIEDYRPEIVNQLSAALGHSVTLGQLRAGWDGWNPTLEIQELAVHGRSEEVLLTLPVVRTTVSWQSLLVLDLRLKALTLERPSLLVRRTAEGRFSIGGLEVDPAHESADARFGDWLLRQRRVEVHDALLIWQDDYRQAPQLLLDRVNFRLENRFGHHRLGLVGTPPPEVAAPIDVRAEFEGDSLTDWARFEGKAYARLDYADVATWREWLPLPAQFARGEGALRLWFSFAEGRPRELTADLELREVAGSLQKGLPELRLKRLAGRLAWRAEREMQVLEAKGLAIDAETASTAQPLDFHLRLKQDGEAFSGGDLRANAIDLAAMNALAQHLPLPENLRQELRERAPRGMIRNAILAWQGQSNDAALAALEADFTGLGLASVRGQPGFSNFSGRIESDAQTGKLHLSARAGAIELPEVFVAPLAFDTLRAKVSWHRRGPATSVQIVEADFANAHAAGSASGEYRYTGEGPGSIDLKGRLSRADPRAVHAYLPLVVGESARNYLKRALTGGAARDARLILRGDLAHFPFDDGRHGLFEIRVRAEDGTMDYAPGWPGLERIRADLLFRGARMEITGNQAETMGIKLAKVQVTIPDLGADEPVLQVRGEAQGASADFLRFVATSPVLEMIDRFTEGMAATGNGKLDLRLAIPLAKPEEAKVVGEFAVTNNRLVLGDEVPPLDRVTGAIRFTEDDVRAEGVNGEMLGGPAQALVSSEEGSVRISARGTAQAAELARFYDSPVLRHVSGSSDWQADVRVRGGKAQWAIDSSLRGLALDLPEPLRKPAEEPLPLHVEQRELEQGRTLFALTLGNRVEFQTLRARDPASGAMVFERAFLGFGGAALDLSRPGLWVRGEIESLALDRWIDLRPEAAGPPGRYDAAWPRGADLVGLDLKLGLLTVMNRRFEELRLTANTRGGGVNLNVAGKSIAGTLEWSEPTPTHPNGQLVARLQRLTLPAEEDAPAKEASADDVADTDGWPALDIIAEDFNSKGRALGRLELKASAEGQDWKLERLKLANDDGVLEASGKWSIRTPAQETRCQLRLEVREAGPYLARFGMPDAVRAAPAKLSGTLAWAGPPNDLDYGSLSGSLRLEVGKGQFTKIEPGLGKLLGVLSLQALPRRLTLDFGDIFSTGFAFDSLAGNIAIERGVMSTERLLLDGPAAKVEIRGRANIAAETQDLRVTVFPSLATSAALIGGLAVNPVAGGVTWLVSKMLKDPLDRLFSYEYHVTGPWSDPQVATVTANAANSATDLSRTP